MLKNNDIPTPDNYAWPITNRIAEAWVNEGHVSLRWSDGQHSRFHAMWLRDNCACPECTHPVTVEQSIYLLDIPEDIAADTATIEATGGLRVTWRGNDHISIYNPGWLYTHSGLKQPHQNERILWAAEDLKKPPTFDGPSAMINDDTLYDVLTTVDRYGIARLRGLPTTKNTVEKFANRIGSIRETHFERIFNVLSRPDADSNAYTSAELSAHTDIPTRETPPGLQLLHCLIAEAKGGESVMVDGFRIAEDIRKDYPEIFENLSTVKWTFANRAGETDFRWQSPHFVLEEDGSLKEIRLVSFSRGPLMTDFEQVEPSYRALRHFLRMTDLDRYRLVFPFTAGDLVIFDNRRILHGRKAFDPSTGERHLQGTYVDRDDLLSTIRMIEHRRDRKFTTT